MFDGDGDPEWPNATWERDTNGHPTPPPDIVWLYRTASTDELKYSIRSLTECLNHGQVWIVGDKPHWYTGNHMPRATKGDIRQNTWGALAAICANKTISDHFILANDDMFCLEPQGVMPLLHRGVLTEQLARQTARNPRSSYVRSLQQAHNILTDEGVVEQYDYEAHTPMPMTKAGVLLALQVLRNHPAQWPSKRTMIGNLSGETGTLVPGPIPGTHDVKVRNPAHGLPTGPWLSTNERTWANHFRTSIAAQYPTPSAVEK